MRRDLQRKGGVVLQSREPAIVGAPQRRAGPLPLPRAKQALASLLLIASVAACRNQPGTSSQTPVDADSARAVAEGIARRSGCAAFEDYDLSANQHWDFSCQIGSQMFLLRAVSSRPERAARIAELTSANRPFVAGDHCLVWQFDTPGQISAAGDLARFRDALR